MVSDWNAWGREGCALGGPPRATLNTEELGAKMIHVEPIYLKFFKPIRSSNDF